MIAMQLRAGRLVYATRYSNAGFFGRRETCAEFDTTRRRKMSTARLLAAAEQPAMLGKLPPFFTLRLSCVS
ncbi:MAG: hypothetical protein C0483_11090 [Pirellula sp.]|nr:hypothetical protein [Pirellula sp.]